MVLAIESEHYGVSHNYELWNWAKERLFEVNYELITAVFA